MTDKEKIADAANNVENKYIKNIPENFWFLRFLDQYLLGSAHTGIRVMAITSVENQRKSYLTLLEIQHLKMMSYRCII